MKKLLLLSAVSVITFFNAAAQEYPIEWERYTSREYIYDIKTGSNTAGMSETDFTEYLLNSARTGLALHVLNVGGNTIVGTGYRMKFDTLEHNYYEFQVYRWNYLGKAMYGVSLKEAKTIK